MTGSEFAAAWKLALSSVDLDKFDDIALDGVGLSGFQPVVVPIEAVARFLRWQCVYIFGGGYDGEELERCRRLLVRPSRRVEILKTDEFLYSAVASLLGVQAET